MICTRNREDKLGTAVQSVLANDFPSFDLTIIAKVFADEPDGELLYGQVAAAGDTPDDAAQTPTLAIPVAQRLSKKDFDLAFRAYRGGHVILLRPDVILRHDGRREGVDDGAAMFTAYGTGDGAFYTKHLRCGDPLALWLLCRQVASHAAKLVYMGIVRRHRRDRSADLHYLVGVFAGIRRSFRYCVDRNARMYLDPSAPAPT